MTEAERILREASTVLVVDYPTRAVPETLARAGFDVVVRGGPGPQDYSAYEVHDDEVVRRPTGRPPQHADVVYVHRPVSELAGIARTAQELGARAVWLQSGLDELGEKDPEGCWMSDDHLVAARTAVEPAGIALVWDESIVAVARRIRPHAG